MPQFSSTLSRAAIRQKVFCCLAGIVVASILATLPSAAYAQAPAVVTHPPPKSTKRPEAKPIWNELTSAQQHALAPLVDDWHKLDQAHKEKWLLISKKFANMTALEQRRLQERMREWVKLTPAQHRAIRESYARAKKLDTEKKSEQWQSYLQLPEEQKKQLATAKLPKRLTSIQPPHRKISASSLPPTQTLEQAQVNPGIALPATPAVPAAAPAAIPAPAAANP